LTRITIDVGVAVRYVELLSLIQDPATENEARHILDNLPEEFCKQSNKINLLWQEKSSNWTGKMTSLSRPYDSATRMYRFAISFSEDEADECATKAVLRRWDLRH
jgi:hypothetical protein